MLQSRGKTTNIFGYKCSKQRYFTTFIEQEEDTVAYHCYFLCSFTLIEQNSGSEVVRVRNNLPKTAVTC